MALKALDQRLAGGALSPSPRTGSTSTNGAPRQTTPGDAVPSDSTDIADEADVTKGKDGQDSR